MHIVHRGFSQSEFDTFGSISRKAKPVLSWLTYMSTEGCVALTVHSATHIELQYRKHVICYKARIQAILTVLL